MLNFDFLEEGLRIVPLPHMIFQEKYFSCYILLTNQISWTDCIYFLRCWTIFGLQLPFSQVVTSLDLELNLLFESSSFLPDQNLKS